MKRYSVQKITGVYSGAGWKSRSDMKTEYAVVIEPYGISVKTFEDEKEAIEYCNKKNNV